MAFFDTKNPLNSTFFFGILSVLRSGISVILLPIFLNYILPEQYGIFSLVVIYSKVFTTIGSFGLKSALSTFHFDFDDKDELKKYLNNIFSIHLISFFFIGLLHVFLGDYIYDLIFESDEVVFFNYGLVALLLAFLSNLNGLYFIYLKNELKLKIYLRYSVFIIGITALLQFVLITHYQLGIYGLLIGSLIPNILIFIAITYFNSYLVSLKLKKELILPSFKYSLKLLPFLLFFAFENQIDKYLIELNLGLKEVGIYALLIKIFSLLLLSIGALDNGIRPFLFKDLKTNNPIKAYFSIYLGFCVLILAALVSIGFNLELIINNPEYLKIRKYLFLGSVAFILLIPVRFYGLILIYFKASAKLSIITTIKVSLIIALMLILIPEFGLNGALYALLISNVFNTTLFAILLHKKIEVLPSFKTLLFVLLFIFCTYLLNYYSTSPLKIWFSVSYFVIMGVTFLLFFSKEINSFRNRITI